MKVTLLNPVKYAGQRHEPGGSLDLAENEAKRLAALGAVALDETELAADDPAAEAIQRMIDTGRTPSELAAVTVKDLSALAGMKLSRAQIDRVLGPLTEAEKLKAEAVAAAIEVIKAMGEAAFKDGAPDFETVKASWKGDIPVDETLTDAIAAIGLEG